METIRILYPRRTVAGGRIEREVTRA